MREHLKYLLGGRGCGLRDRLLSAIRRVESYQRGLVDLRRRLEARRIALSEAAVRAINCKDDARASVYADGYNEAEMAFHAARKGELTLIRLELRLKSLLDLGDVVYQLSSALSVLREVSRIMGMVAPALERALEEFSRAVNETLVELGKVPSNININLANSSSEEILEMAKDYAERRALLLKEGDLERADWLALLEAGDGSKGPSAETLLASAETGSLDCTSYEYATGKGAEPNTADSSFRAKPLSR